MTDHEEFEKWWLTKFSAEFLDSDNCWSAWTGWQARGELDAVKIKELEVENHALGLIIDNEDKELADKVAELTAKLDKAREALNVIVDWTKDSYACHIAETALKELDK